MTQGYNPTCKDPTCSVCGAQHVLLSCHSIPVAIGSRDAPIFDLPPLNAHLQSLVPSGDPIKVWKAWQERERERKQLAKAAGVAG